MIIFFFKRRLIPQYIAYGRNCHGQIHLRQKVETLKCHCKNCPS